ncbi:copii-coated vesicle protein [Diplodia corticola]|uniref:Endoplasmic reticulum-Golgi intermediate compartment protein n=1 Tax=Diplodia corticola TaxID=236234 RepID=A0A1J9S0V5_9PEZI|nr:copii-coated vesicle protein [Diplodia corticola]OJD33285.1 copii-coated vesicle protein [Diplodia corticola]
MNGFADQGLSEDSFGPSGGGLQAFDAFPKTKKTYLQQTTQGANWTLLLIVTCVWLSITETMRWWVGETSHTFSVEKGVGHEMQINLDIVVAMRCDDLHVNIQDASGDRILAGSALTKDHTRWLQWVEKSKNVHKLERSQGQKRYEEDDVHDYVGAKVKRKFPKTPRFRGAADSCRIYGSLDANRVQGDFHITARGHGYMAFGEHLEHSQFNFSHQINELSFGPYYPSLTNPLDDTRLVTPTENDHFYKFQYYLSVVPTVYTDNSHNIVTNQYAVTEQSHSVSEVSVPGVFVKFDIEPIMLTISEYNGGFLALLIRLVNVVSGVMVAGGWCFRVGEALVEFYGKRKNRGDGLGVLHGRTPSYDEKRSI